jgi:hypothetical protein
MRQRPSVGTRRFQILSVPDTAVARNWLLICCGFFLSSVAVCQAYAAEQSTAASTADHQVVEYASDFFARYRPTTALDMVRQLPGFQLDDGGEARGFATSAGNILINGRRPTAKQDLPSATLSRIPASRVERIEIIRGQSAGIDFQGHSALANVYLRADLPAAVRWELWAQRNDAAPFKPGGSISLSDRLRDIRYNVGIDVERDTSGWFGTESVYDPDGTLLETGPNDSSETGFRVNSLSLNSGTSIGEYFAQLNARFTGNNSTYIRPASSVSQLPGGTTSNVLLESDIENRQYELGTDIERSVRTDLSGKGILLFVNKDRSDYATRQESDSVAGQTLLRIADTDTTEKEFIARAEFDWSGSADHALQINIERAFNVLDRSLAQFDDRGDGPVEVDVPGGNSRVEEVRWDFLIQDTWALGDFELDYGMGAEASTLSQSGDAVLDRDFFFLKPLAILTYAPSPAQQSRFRVAREVSQLNLDDFVSATVFEDDDLALGNPNIKPDTTWVAEAIFEQRFQKDSALKLTVFHHWISDVLDLLPLSSNFEAPGNIGDGRRWGVELESTLPLDRLGLRGAKMDLQARWQDSVVTDPVTGEDRVLSGEGGGSGYRTLGRLNKNIKYYVRLDFRQDIEDARIAWGWTIADRDKRPLFKVDELDVNSEGTAVDIFIESTRWFGIKMRILAENVLNFRRSRERTLYVGERELTAVESIIERDRRHDISRVSLTLSGSF